jgi:hypothetical protein
MGLIRDLGFIDAKPGSSGEFHFVLLLNPHKVVWNLRKKIQPQLFMQLFDRAVDIGANDMKAPEVLDDMGNDGKQPKLPRKVKQLAQ